MRTRVRTALVRLRPIGLVAVLLAPMAGGDGATAATATIVPGGAAVTVTTTAAQEDATVTFNGTAGRRISLRISNVTIGTSTCCGSYVSIKKPDGTLLAPRAAFGTKGLFVDTKTLAATGTYTILIDPQGTATGSATLRLFDVPPDVTLAVVPGGASATATTTTPGQNAAFTFAGIAGQRVAMTVDPVCCAGSVWIERDSGTLVGAKKTMTMTGGWVDPVTLPADAQYRVVYDLKEQSTGSVSVRVHDVPPDVTMTIAPGGPSAALYTMAAGQNGVLTFAGIAGQRISLRLTDVLVGTGCCSARLSILGPTGTTLVSPHAVGPTARNFVDAIVLPATGVYTILFDPQKAQVGSATFTLYDVPPDVTTTITPNGGTVTVTTTVPGQNGRLSFDALAGRAHSLRLGSTPCCTSKLSVLRPDGTTLISPKRLGGNGGLLEFTPSTDGVHTIMVDPEFHVLGSLPLTLTTAAADITGTIVAGGAAQTLTIGSAGQNARLTFSGATGQRVSATLTGCCAADVSILRADGTVLVPATRLSASGGFLEPKLLPVDGVYTLVIDPVGSATGTLTIRLHDVPPDVTDVLGAGTPSSVTLAAPGQNAKLAFSGTVGDRISVTVSGVTVGGSNCCGVNVSLLSPTGTTLAMVSNVGSSGGFIDAMTLAATGTYTVLVDGIGGQTGDAAVRIDLVASDVEGSVATNGTQTMLTTTTPGQNARFTFTGTAGDGIHVTASALCCQAAVSLLRPDGSRLAGPVTSSSGATLNTRLDVTGVHTVLVDPTGSATGSATVRVQLDNSPPAPPLLSLTESAADSHAAGGMLFYRPTGAGGAFTVTASTSDPISGVSQVTFPGLSGGFLPATSLADTVTPFSRGYTWSSGATLSDPTVVVTARDGVGNTSTASYGITPDSLAPSTTDSSASLGNGWHNTSQTVVLTPTDAGSGVAATNWTIDGSTPTGSSSQGTSVALSSDGVYTVRYRSTDNVGNAEAVRVAGSQIRIDRTSPSTATLATLPAAIRNGQALSAAAADALSGVSFMTYLYCAGAACTPATVIASSTAGPSYPVSWSDMPADGTYQVLVRATDVAGNIRDSAKQTVTIDNTPPVTAISSGPASPTSVTTATFTFSSQSGSTFQCQLDGAAYAACTSPRSYTALADGTHTFHVRATDPAGNTEVAPPSWTWTIDTVVPDTTLASAPPTQSASDTATFTFSSPDSTATFECRLDAGAYAACASPWTLSSLSDGPHTAVIRSVDAAGNRDGSPVTHGWTIDTTAPETSITASPVTPSPSGDASFSFTSPDSAATFQCRLDAGSWTSCASPTSYTGLPEGSHSFEVRGVDPLANTDPTPSTQTWIIDTTAPDTTITTGPTDPSDTADAAFTFTSPESPATFECRLDGGTWLTCTSPWSLTALPSGSHTAEVRAVDPAGNPDETPASHTWTVAPPLP